MGPTTESLKILYGEIGWLRRPWPDILLGKGADELSANLAGDDRLILLPHEGAPADWPDPRTLGSEGEPFYRLVANLHHAFVEEDWQMVRGFYATHGPLGDPKWIKQRPQGERVGWCRHALAWFRSLVELTDILQAEDDAALWRWVEPGLPYVGGGELDLVRWSTPGALLLDDGLTTIDVVPTEGQRWPRQKDRNELYALVWGAVIDAVQRKLATTHLEPILRDLHKPRQPIVRWGFIAEGALDAAFLEWFFEVFAPFRRLTCERPGCDQFVPRHRRKYCSPQCSAAHRQQRRRDRLDVQRAG